MRPTNRHHLHFTLSFVATLTVNRGCRGWPRRRGKWESARETLSHREPRESARALPRQPRRRPRTFVSHFRFMLRVEVGRSHGRVVGSCSSTSGSDDVVRRRCKCACLLPFPPKRCQMAPTASSTVSTAPTKTPTKRGRYSTMTIEKKAAIIKEVESGRSQAEVAREFNRRPRQTPCRMHSLSAQRT